ncbi:hypothetical protein EAO70_08875 [Streptomyces sp. adm13(2018)]|nr:hypothetical protein EAO70_08875 [Streptomyces sp. adm13(2018)]
MCGFELGEGCPMTCGSLFEGGFAGGAVACLCLRQGRLVCGVGGLAGGLVERVGLLQRGAFLPMRDEHAHGDASERDQGGYAGEVHDRE